MQPKLADTCVHGNFVSVRSGELLHLETILVWGSVLSEDTIFSLYCILNGGTIEQIVL